MKNKQKLGDWIKEKYNVELPIEKGGTGAKVNPFIVKYVQPNDYVGVEYALVKYLYEYLNEEILDHSQAFISHEGRKYDKLTVSSRDPETQEIGYRELYFDITDCIGK